MSETQTHLPSWKKDGIPESKVTLIRFPKLQVRRQTIFQFFFVMGHLTINSKDAIHICGPVLSAMADTNFVVKGKAQLSLWSGDILLAPLNKAKHEASC